jgi:hypothetical protein
MIDCEHNVTMAAGKHLCEKCDNAAEAGEKWCIHQELNLKPADP